MATVFILTFKLSASLCVFHFAKQLVQSQVYSWTMLLDCACVANYWNRLNIIILSRHPKAGRRAELPRVLLLIHWNLLVCDQILQVLPILFSSWFFTSHRYFLAKWVATALLYHVLDGLSGSEIDLSWHFGTTLLIIQLGPFDYLDVFVSEIDSGHPCFITQHITWVFNIIHSFCWRLYRCFCKRILALLGRSHIFISFPHAHYWAVVVRWLGSLMGGLA